jgi:hypothetical protein
VQPPGVTVTARSSQVSFASARAVATGNNINCAHGDTHLENHLLTRPSSPDPRGVWDSGDISSSAVAPLLGCQDSSADASAELSTRTIHDVQSVDGDLTVTYTATDEHALTMNRTGTLVDNDASTSVLSLLGVRFDVVRDTVQLSCSTTLSDDPRDPQPHEVEDQVFELGVSVATTGAPVVTLEDTTAATLVTLPPGTYGLVVENKTARHRSNQTADVNFTFGAAAECHRVA